VAIDVSDDTVLVHGVGFSSYRSVRDLQLVGPMRKITVLAGRNNAGKSNILRFLRDHYSNAVANLGASPGKVFEWTTGEDAPYGLAGGPVSFAVCRDLSAPEVHEWASALQEPPLPGRPTGVTMGSERASVLLRLLGEATYGSPSVLWRVWDRERPEAAPSDQGLARRLGGAFRENQRLKDLGSFLGDPPDRLIVQQLLPPVPLRLAFDPVFIPAFRQIRAGGGAAWDGTGLIPILADLREPDLGPDRAEKQARWTTFVEFVRSVLERPEAEIRVPAEVSRLIVEMDGRELDIEDLGTGVHEVIILAAAATAHQGTLFLIEEPEIHLHPLLQRRLLDYLASSTNNQYVIATHSAHLLDFENAAVFRVSMVDGWTEVTRVDTNTARIEAARELGYRPSDLLQANAVIWVEGPSDRIYLNYWIRTVDPTLDYSIMFYGGSLVAHLSGKDTRFGLGVDELIELRRLNRICGIVVDSDRKTGGERILRETTKGRLRQEFGDGGFAWITQGREVENYIPPGVMLDAIRDLDPEAARLVSADNDYAPRWRYRRAGSNKIHDAPKVRLAQAVVKLQPTLDVLDLKQQVAKVVKLIRSGYA